jgi:hypothetical protein
VDRNRSDVVGVRLEGGNLFARVVVVNADLAVTQGSVRPPPVGKSDSCIQIIRPADDPVLPGNEATGTDRDIGELESLDNLLGLVRPDVDMATVEGGCSRGCQRVRLTSRRICGRTENPWLGRVEVNAFDSLSSLC